MECQLNAKSTSELRRATCDLISPEHGEQISKLCQPQRVRMGKDVFFVMRELLANMSPPSTDNLLLRFSDINHVYQE